MQHLTSEELLAFVGLLLALLATIAAIAVVRPKRTRTMLWTCLAGWSVLTSILLVQHYIPGASEGGAQPTNDFTNPSADTEKAEHVAVARDTTPEPVVGPPPQPGIPDSSGLPPPPNPTVDARDAPVESPPLGLNAIRAQFVGSWTGPLPSSGSPPTVMTITFHADGRMEQKFSEVERPQGQVQHPNVTKSFVHGRLRFFRAPRRYEVPTRDSVVIGTLRQANAFHFVGPDTLIWTQVILKFHPETTTLVRVRN